MKAHQSQRSPLFSTEGHPWATAPKVTLSTIFRKLDTPIKIQNFLDKVPFNFEKRGETYHSPLEAIKANKMHCFEGALLALSCFNFHHKKAFLVDLKTGDLKNDADHVLTVFQINKRWGAISKTNHAVLRYRDPIYPSIESLVYSYFHEYFLDNGKKTLFSYSLPFDVFGRFGKSWIYAKEDLDEIALALDRVKHSRFFPEKNREFIRKASKIEIEAGKLEEWKSA